MVLQQQIREGLAWYKKRQEMADYMVENGHGGTNAWIKWCRDNPTTVSDKIDLIAYHMFYSQIPYYTIQFIKQAYKVGTGNENPIKAIINLINEPDSSLGEQVTEYLEFNEWPAKLE